MSTGESVTTFAFIQSEIGAHLSLQASLRLTIVDFSVWQQCIIRIPEPIQTSRTDINTDIAMFALCLFIDAKIIRK